jgi:hypothetical protein
MAASFSNPEFARFPLLPVRPWWAAKEKGHPATGGESTD